jgi:hypothetical protein
MSRFHDDRTAASDPGGIRLSRERFRRLEPLTAQLPEHLARRFANRAEFEAMLDEHLRLGDSRAACVMSIEPLLVAAFTDELDCIALLCFPGEVVAEHRLKVGSRLLTVNSYTRGSQVAADLLAGPRNLRRWVNFYPVIADFLSDDTERIALRKAHITAEEWKRCAQMGRAYLDTFVGLWRNGSPFWSSQPVV